VRLRQARAKPILDDLESWLHAQLPKISGKSELAKASRYALARMKKLRPYLDQGCLEADNNCAERALKPVALGRKNFLFVGSDEGASCCSSHHAFIIQEDFVADRQAAGVVSAARRLDGGHRRSTGRARRMFQGAPLQG